MQVNATRRLDLPDSLRRKLMEYRRRVWIIKTFEATAGAVIGVLVGFLVVFCLDRVFDTPGPVRWLIFAAAAAACMAVPLALDRWVWRRRRLDQLARLLTRTHPDVGDQLLGVIELSENSDEQARSPVLVQAAIAQVAEDVQRRDLSRAIPEPRHKQRAWIAGGLATAVFGLLVATTAASTNAWLRFLTPWSDTPRYTFASIDPLPEKLVVPHGEPFHVSIELAETSQWHPSTAEVRLAGLGPTQTSLKQQSYQFELPGQIQSSPLDVRVGDYRGRTTVEPMLRPELKLISTQIDLPEYLGRDQPIGQEVRGGQVAVVRGSRVTILAEATRELASASINGAPRNPDGPRFSSEPLSVDSQAKIELQWKDGHGLTGLEPLELTVQGIDDEAPSLVCENLPRRKVLLLSEVLSFQVRARDDFGVKRVGIQWQGLDTTLAKPAAGERIVGVGDPNADFLELAATFSAEHAGIEPQPISLRVFVEDYLPDRERIYSPVCIFDVLSAEQHAIWITSQLSRWHRMSLDVRDKELQLHQTNKQLRSLTSEQLNQPGSRQQLSAQAEAERANGRRLDHLVRGGEELLAEAMRNPEIGVGHLDRWAEMMQVLKDIAGNRMPSVASLLKQASKAPAGLQKSPSNSAPVAGQNRLSQGGNKPSEPTDAKKPPTQVPTITDVESSHQQPTPGEPKEPSESKPKQPRLTLPTTMLAGKPSEKSKPPAAKDDGKLDDAVQQQEDLLAEFEKIADELNTILANLEGSTLVKRLKAASREQQKVAGSLASLAGNAFGASKVEKSVLDDEFQGLAEAEATSGEKASNIMDDMAAYFERSRMARFKAVLDDMRQQDVTTGLRNLSEDLKEESGLAIAQAEYWSETFDRWAEDLVEVTKGGACPGCKSKGSLPPSIVLEVLQVLEGEVKLREQTRVAQQAKPAVSAEDHEQEAEKLSQSQDDFRGRIDRVVERILELPDAQTDFGKELNMLSQVSAVMSEATEILSTPETGAPAIAAETEAIELLLQSKRFNPSGGGGGGANPGGGGSGDTQTEALALVGSGINAKEVQAQPAATQTAGAVGPGLPEEFRAGLDEYFNRLETWEQP